MFAFKELMAWYEDKLHTQIRHRTQTKGVYRSEMLKD